MLPFAHPGRNFHLQCFLPSYNTAMLIGFMDCKRYLFLGAVKHFLQEQCQPCVNILTAHAHVLPETTSTPPGALSATTHLLKEVTELSGVCIGVSTTPKPRGTLPTGRWLERAIGLGAVFSQLVVF